VRKWESVSSLFHQLPPLYLHITMSAMLPNDDAPGTPPCTSDVPPVPAEDSRPTSTWKNWNRSEAPPPYVDLATMLLQAEQDIVARGL